MSEEIISSKLNPKQKISSLIVSSEFFNNLHWDNSEYSICKFIKTSHFHTVVVARYCPDTQIADFDVSIVRVDIDRFAGQLPVDEIL